MVGVDEYQRGPVLFDQSCQTAVDLIPNLGRHDGFERRVGNLQGEIAVAAMSGIHDGAVRAALAADAGADQKPRDVLDGFLCRREPDAQRRNWADR